MMLNSLLKPLRICDCRCRAISKLLGFFYVLINVWLFKNSFSLVVLCVELLLLQWEGGKRVVLLSLLSSFLSKQIYLPKNTRKD